MPFFELHLHIEDRNVAQALQHITNKVNHMADIVQDLQDALAAQTDTLTNLAADNIAKDLKIDASIARLEAHIAELEAAGAVVDPKLVDLLAGMKTNTQKLQDVDASILAKTPADAPVEVTP